MHYEIESGALPFGQEVVVCFFDADGHPLRREFREADAPVLEGVAPANAHRVSATPLGRQQGELWVEGELRWWPRGEPEGVWVRMRRSLAASIRRLF